jgi:hypothetical protein
MSTRYLREWTAATERANAVTPDLFAETQCKILGVRRTLSKLGASSAVDLETLDACALEQLRAELAEQLRRKSPASPRNDNHRTKL